VPSRSFAGDTLEGGTEKKRSGSLLFPSRLANKGARREKGIVSYLEKQG